MPRHLMLLRHAKSSWDDPTLADRDRPLAPRGVKALPMLREHVGRAGCSPDIVLCSPARRTIDTLEGIRPALDGRALVEIDEALYGMDDDELLDRLRELDGVGCAMVIGHNPCIQDLAVLLAGSGNSETLGQLDAKFPTGAAVTLSFDVEWAELAAGCAHAEELFMPRRPQS